MRDWRNAKVMKMDPRNFDVMAAAHRLMDVNEPYMLLSGYRSPETNAMLRSKSSGVARNSLHMKGQAADLRLKSRSVGQMARAAKTCSGGGVGTYSRSNFVHMDCGPVRTWGGCTRYRRKSASLRAPWGALFADLTCGIVSRAPVNPDPNPRRRRADLRCGRGIPSPPRISRNCRPGLMAV